MTLNGITNIEVIKENKKQDFKWDNHTIYNAITQVILQVHPFFDILFKY